MSRHDRWGTKGRRRTPIAAGLGLLAFLPASWANGEPTPASPPAPSASALPAPPPPAAPAPQGSPNAAPPYPYPYPYPYTYGFRPYPKGAPEKRPDVITYEPGMVIPPGYEYVERRRKKLVATGSVMFGVMYGITLMGGIISLLDGDDEYAPMLVPLIGPFLTVGSARHIDGLWTVFFLTDGLVQVAGAALLVTGIAWEEKVLVREKPAKTSLAPELLVGPGSIGMRLRF